MYGVRKHARRRPSIRRCWHCFALAVWRMHWELAGIAHDMSLLAHVLYLEEGVPYDYRRVST